MKRLLFSIFTFAAFATNAHASDCDPCCNSYGSFAVGADWLLWRTEETQLNYAAEVSGTFTPTLDISSTILRPKFEYKNGFRVFTDYTTPNNCWTFNGVFTHVPGGGKNNVDELGMNGVNFGQLFSAAFPILTAVSSAMYSDLSADWDNHVNYFDVTTARTFNVCRNLDVSPYVGVRGLWVCQSLRLAGSGLNGTDPVTFTSTLRGRVCVGGIQGGLNGAWDLYKGFSIIANVGGAVCYGSFKNTGSLNMTTIDGLSRISYSDIPYKCLPMFDAFIGVRYLTCVQGWGIDVHAGWEQHIIYEVSNYSLNGSGAMSLEGLTLGGAVHF